MFPDPLEAETALRQAAEEDRGFRIHFDEGQVSGLSLHEPGTAEAYAAAGGVDMPDAGGSGQGAPAYGGTGSNPYLDQLWAIMSDAIRKRGDLADEEAARSRELWGIYKDTYLPGEKAWAAESFKKRGGIPYQQAVDWASADVYGAYDKVGDQAQRAMAQRGLGPDSPAYQATMRDYEMARAAAEAGARNKARREVRDINRAIRSEDWERAKQATAMGRGLIPPSTQLIGMSSESWRDQAGLYGQLGMHTQSLAAQQAIAELQSKTAKAIAHAKIAAQKEMAALNAKLQREQIASAESSSMWSTIGQLVGTVGGFAIGTAMTGGNPFGGFVGAQMGGSLGGSYSRVPDNFGSGTYDWFYNP
jgi:hypothetical protein